MVAHTRTGKPRPFWNVWRVVRMVVVAVLIMMVGFVIGLARTPVQPVSGSGVGQSAAGIVSHVAGASASSVYWAGYAASGAAGSFSSASATFTVPVLHCASGSSEGTMSQWAGLDGVSSGSVEQAGVSDSCAGGVNWARAWYEAYPQPLVLMSSVAISPGDVVSTSTRASGGNYTFVVFDVTTNSSMSTTVAIPGVADSSAECVTEDPSNGYTVGAPPLPYAQYGTSVFAACSVNGSAIGTLSPTSFSTAYAGVVEATTGPLDASGGFVVTRVGLGLAGPVTGMAAMPDGSGYWLVNAAGVVSVHGGATNYGDLGGSSLNAPIAHIVGTPDGRGYWMVAGDGGVFSFGDAGFFGSMGGVPLNAPVVSLAPTSSGHGYWLVASDGGVFSFGDAAFRGSMGGTKLNKPVVGLSGGPGGGYWLVAGDGGVFAFGEAFDGGTGNLVLVSPILAMSTSPDGGGYRFVAGDGGVFCFGDAKFAGSLGGAVKQVPITAMAGDNATGGYWVVDAAGTVTAFGAPGYGSD